MIEVSLVIASIFDCRERASRAAAETLAAAEHGESHIDGARGDADRGQDRLLARSTDRG